MLEEVDVVLPEVQRYVILEGNDVRIIDGAMGVMCLYDRSKSRQRGRKGDRDAEQRNGNTNHGALTYPIYSTF